MDTQHHWQPPQLASDALFLLNAQSGSTLRCGRVERRAVSEALGCVSRKGRLEGLLHCSEVVVAVYIVTVHLALLIVRQVGPAGDGLGGDDLRRTG